MEAVALELDTSRQNSVYVTVVVSGKRYEKSLPSGSKAEMVLPLIEELLREQNLSVSSICVCTVNTGPGSYTGLRVGVAVANTIGWLLSLPVNNKPIGEVLQPDYRE